MDNENIETIKYTEDISDTEDNKFNYNFINRPWDDRSDSSKLGAIALLVAIIATTVALAVNNLVIHYRGFTGSFSTNTEIDCNVVKLDEYPYAARIHLIATNELVCVGAVVSRYSVLANEICLKSGPIRLRIGSPTDPRCKNGFTVDPVELIPHNAVVTKNLVLFSVLENMSGCMRTIKIGLNLDPMKQLYIIGRSFRGGRVLSYQLAKHFAQNATADEMLRSFNKNDTIAVKTFGKCPVRAGDLLVQKGRLLGLASTSVRGKESVKTVYFANLTAVRKELEAIDAEIAFIV